LDALKALRQAADFAAVFFESGVGADPVGIRQPFRSM
jgi:hypothetical protein